MKKIIKVILTFFVVILIFGSVGAAGYFYKQYKEIKDNPNKISVDEIKSLTSEISKFMDLPNDETPTLATVTDKEKLKDQDFFKKSENGDKILIYTNAKKAILYRPSTGKVIEFAPLLIGDGNQEAVPTSEPEVTTKFSTVIYNGTKTEGFASEIEKEINGIKGISVINKTNAAKDDYSQTLVVDVSGSHKTQAREIANTVGGIVSTLPEGEAKPAADILIIAGK